MFKINQQVTTVWKTHVIANGTLFSFLETWTERCFLFKQNANFQAKRTVVSRQVWFEVADNFLQRTRASNASQQKFTASVKCQFWTSLQIITICRIYEIMSCTVFIEFHVHISFYETVFQLFIVLFGRQSNSQVTCAKVNLWKNRDTPYGFIRHSEPKTRLSLSLSQYNNGIFVSKQVTQKQKFPQWRLSQTNVSSEDFKAATKAKSKQISQYQRQNRCCWLTRDHGVPALEWQCLHSCTRLDQEYRKKPRKPTSFLSASRPQPMTKLPPQRSQPLPPANSVNVICAN